MKKCFLHIDMDAFFASIEQRDHPEWREKPVIVGGLPSEKRSVVSTASYEARKYGVHSAMPTAQAYRLCPNGIYTHGNMKHYAEISSEIMQILSHFSPDVEQLSIDEANIDITGTEKLFGPPETLAKQAKSIIMEKTSLTCSCGIASTKYLAKTASEMDKPNGLFVIPEGTEQEFMLSLPLKKIWRIGEKTLVRLHNAGFFTTQQVFEKSIDHLKIIFGDGIGTFLYNTVRGLETETKSAPNHSISSETTFPVDITDKYIAETELMELCDCVMFRMLKEKSHSKTVMIKVRYDDFSTFTAQETGSEYITSTDDLFSRVCHLFEKKTNFSRGIRLLGVGIANLEESGMAIQENLFDFGEKKKQVLENAILNLKSKHPEIKIKKARLV